MEEDKNIVKTGLIVAQAAATWIALDPRRLREFNFYFLEVDSKFCDGDFHNFIEDYLTEFLNVYLFEDLYRIIIDYV